MPTVDSTDSRSHAIVIGAGIAGLLAARVLADYFKRVTIVDKDIETHTPTPRKGVPQGQHSHLLLAGGISALVQLFPDLLTDLKNHGSVLVDASTQVQWFQHGCWKLSSGRKIEVYSQTRPLLEWCLKHSLASQYAIQFLSTSSVINLQTTPDKQRIIGVQVRSKDDGGIKNIAADLVIDASGHGSKSPFWLEKLGYPRLKEAKVGIYLGYGSRLYQPPLNFKPNWKLLAIYPQAPLSTKFGVIFPVEKDRWLVTLGGVLRDYPPEDEQGFLQFAQALDHPSIYQAIQNATPLTPVAKYRLPTYTRRYYEQLREFPENFLVIGDAICNFNPLYGQGITVCALEANALNTCLQQANEDLSQLSQKYFKKAAYIIDHAWEMATIADFFYPKTEGKRPWGHLLIGWYNTQIFQLSAYDPKVATTFYEVIHFLKSPTALFHPYILTKVLQSSLKSSGIRSQINKN
ncbi:monooxygenase FAD-binding protein [Candidatus Nitrosoglobus terrae]|uniref:Monooxygenase FAD-binding protein n=1 Tax=Candidatus Nitrosoglobus terrae TaxID=1630141 RepID=A0A1Q2SL18_9GAMM|nr:FAD-dependent monooxygenase [Candidatus Nitrosoglobus terrae]BAW79802.1 monooxygenase FAD-binding protein [Candidatus Nitrosoglobus terrae]